MDCGEARTPGGCLVSRCSLTVLPSGWTLPFQLLQADYPSTILRTQYDSADAFSRF